MAARKIQVGHLDVRVTAEPLTAGAFAPFGDVVANPRPDVLPTAFAHHAGSLLLPDNAVSANQGFAIQYRHASRVANLYRGDTGKPVLSLFVCAARPLSAAGGRHAAFVVRNLERHPFTTQTFAPVASSAELYLVIVAPSLPPADADEDTPAPPPGDAAGMTPGRGLPNLKELRAFVGTARQAVTYGAGTWHAPMVVLGPPGTTLDFVVTQFASGVAEEDCQLLEFEAEGRPEPQLRVQIPIHNTMAEKLVSVDARNKLEDLSGIVIQPGENPYDVFIKACNDDPAEIQALYDTHRVKRNAQQREKFLATDYKELVIDQYLLRLANPSIQPGFQDERNCLVFWARPPEHVILLASKVQQLLQQTAPNIWLMPVYRMHMTALEVAFSKTPEEIAALTALIRPAVPSIVSHTHRHRARLVKPFVSYDLSAFALSFLPASGEPPLSPPPAGVDLAAQDVTAGDGYTYHHLRRDVFEKVRAAGVEVGSRYQVPSAHITLGRYLSEADHDTPAKRRRWVEAVDEVNRWLEADVWDSHAAAFTGEWVVGQERGLDARSGTLWYGGGRTIQLGEGF
ncbi:Ureidoglycolate hydrolase [Cordyceps militaris CM01]|uniref:Ureidoglycolate hydrolase n=1 Tax=Cordyceps militaris (strain CM01) TaxID=983644 RepID=G3J2U3_CORMM|nr:Ureidoglycolate hydrolase [Cordyceps militaris CM01]EGX96427.1 Ureidoglycolate hydrolase [Cordyceps militaris CM01]